MKTCISALILIISLALHGQESESAEPAPEEEIADQRELTLLYGIEADVLSLLGNLRTEGTETYNTLLVEVLDDTRDALIAQAIYSLWEETSFAEGGERARDELQTAIDDSDYSLPAVQSAMSYLAGIQDAESEELLLKLSENRDTVLAASAVRALGRIGSVSDPETLQPLLERLEKEDLPAQEELAAALITALGDLAYLPAADELLLIAEDAGSSLGHRQLACLALGKIGRREDYPAVERIYYESEEALLRSYALAGLAEFEDQDNTSLLVQALKRDPFWRIRVTAAEKLAGNTGDGVFELLEYKAGGDPVKHVRFAALKSLGASGNSEVHNFLIDYFVSPEHSAEARLNALNVLVENEIQGTPGAINSEMDKLWEKDQGRYLEFMCRNLSRANWPALEPIYERMLTHRNWLLQVYGIRGIRGSGIENLFPKIDALDADGVDSRVRQEVAAE